MHFNIKTSGKKIISMSGDTYVHLSNHKGPQGFFPGFGAHRSQQFRTTGESNTVSCQLLTSFFGRNVVVLMLVSSSIQCSLWIIFYMLSNMIYFSVFFSSSYSPKFSMYGALFSLFFLLLLNPVFSCFKSAFL